MKVTIKRLLFCYTIISSVCLSAQDNDYKTFQKNTMDGTKVGATNKKTGKEVLPAIYDAVEGYSNHRFFVKKNGKLGVVDTTGKIIVPIIYDDGGYIGDRAFFLKGTKIAMFNYDAGVAMTSFLFDDVLGYESGVIRVKIADKTGYIDKYGKYILQCKFTEGQDCKNGFILVMEKSSMSTGYEYVTKDQHGNVTSKEDIVKNGKVPIVFNTKGQIVYKGVQGETIIFNNGSSTFVVEEQGTYTGGSYHKLIDASGKVLIPYSSKYKFYNNNNWLTLVANSYSNYPDHPTYGIVNLDGKILLKPNFKKISEYEFRNKELAKVFFQDGAFFYIDKNASCVEHDGIKCPD